MSLKTPEKIRDLQIKLYRKAKNEPNTALPALRQDITGRTSINHAYELAQSQSRAGPGVDGETFQGIEAKGWTEWMKDSEKIYGIGRTNHSR